MWHLAALTEDLVTATLTDLNVVADGIISIVNGHLMPPDDVDLFFSVGFGTNLQRARITTPKLRQVSPIFIRPIQPTLIGANDINVAYYAELPLRLSRNEEIVVEAIQNAGANQQITVLLAFGRDRRPVPPGDPFTVRYTSTTAATANAWSLLTYTLDSTLPAGNYAMVGSEMFSTNGQAHRITFDNQFYRPGFPSVAAATHRLPYPMYGYDMGVMGFFTTTTLPRVEVLCNGADATHEGYFKIVKIG